MELTTTKKILKEAQDGHYAIGAFNVENMEMVMDFSLTTIHMIVAKLVVSL